MSRYSTLLLLSFSLILFSCNSKNEKTNEKSKKSSITVEAFLVENKDFNYTQTFAGNIIAGESVELHSEISGKITKINFKEGSFVSKGQLLVKINDADLQAQLKKNSLQIELATTDENRKKELLKINGISKEEYDISLNKLNSLLAEKDLILAQIAKTEIVAPFSGNIGLRNISEGAYISPQITVSTIQQIDPIKVEFSVPEKYKNFLTTDKFIEFTTDANKKTYKAKIYASESFVNEITRNIKVRAIAQNQHKELKPGAFVTVDINLSDENKRIFVPAKALISIANGEKIIVIKNGKAKDQIVETGIRTSEEVEILKGLAQGDTIALSGLLQLKSGMSVNTKFNKSVKK